MRVAFVPVWSGNPYHTELEKALRSAGVDVVCPESLKSLYADYISGKEKLDVLHLHALPYFGLSPMSIGRYIMFYSRLNRLQQLGVRIVWTVHDFQNHDSMCWRIEDFVNRKLSRRLDAMIVHGKTAKEIIESQWGTHACRRIFVIPHGNYLQSYKNHISAGDARASLGLDASSLVFLFLGLIRPYKGVVEMVKAFRSHADPNSRLIIAGRPVDEGIKKDVELSIQQDSRIKFFSGRVEDDRVQVYMNACDAAVLPYRRSLTSGAVVLAMSFGKACIAPQIGCTSDMLDEKGAVFFDPAVDGDLERAFQEIVARRQELAAMGHHNLQRARSWDWESIGRETAAVYERCIAKQENNVRVARTVTNL